MMGDSDNIFHRAQTPEIRRLKRAMTLRVLADAIGDEETLHMQAMHLQDTDGVLLPPSRDEMAGIYLPIAISHFLRACADHLIQKAGEAE